MTLKQLFLAYSQGRGHHSSSQVVGPKVINGAKFAKLCKDGGLQEFYTSPDIDMAFVKSTINGNNKRTMNFKEFLVALRLLGDQYALEKEEIEVFMLNHIAGSKKHHSGPSAPSNRLYEDTSTYTGVHKAGGPSFVDHVGIETRVSRGIHEENNLLNVRAANGSTTPQSIFSFSAPNPHITLSPSAPTTANLTSSAPTPPTAASERAVDPYPGFQESDTLSIGDLQSSGVSCGTSIAAAAEARGSWGVGFSESVDLDAGASETKRPREALTGAPLAALRASFLAYCHEPGEMLPSPGDLAKAPALMSSFKFAKFCRDANFMEDKGVAGLRYEDLDIIFLQAQRSGEALRGSKLRVQGRGKVGNAAARKLDWLAFRQALALVAARLGMQAVDVEVYLTSANEGQLQVRPFFHCTALKISLKIPLRPNVFSHSLLMDSNFNFPVSHSLILSQSLSLSLFHTHTHIYIYMYLLFVVLQPHLTSPTVVQGTKFHDDLSLYTGVHRSGGLTTVEVTRLGLHAQVDRSRKTEISLRAVKGMAPSSDALPAGMSPKLLRKAAAASHLSSSLTSTSSTSSPPPPPPPSSSSSSSAKRVESEGEREFATMINMMMDTHGREAKGSLPWDSESGSPQGTTNSFRRAFKQAISIALAQSSERSLPGSPNSSSSSGRNSSRGRSPTSAPGANNPSSSSPRSPSALRNFHSSSLSSLSPPAQCHEGGQDAGQAQAQAQAQGGSSNSSLLSALTATMPQTAEDALRVMFDAFVDLPGSKMSAAAFAKLVSMSGGGQVISAQVALGVLKRSCR
jgi:hypothetical protein